MDRYVVARITEGLRKAGIVGNRLPFSRRVCEWIAAREVLGLSHAEVHMAREVGFNPTSILTYEKPRRKRGMPCVNRFVRSKFRTRYGFVLEDALPIEEERRGRILQESSWTDATAGVEEGG